MILATWTYTRDEWKAFLKWKLLRKGVFHYLMHWLKPGKHKNVPAIQITHDRVWINEAPEAFQNELRKVHKINIHDAGKLNVMEISYQMTGSNGTSSDEIRIPIPKGKLREAIEVQDQLMKANFLFS